jgi:PTS system mannose-specific IIA component
VSGCITGISMWAAGATCFRRLLGETDTGESVGGGAMIGIVVVCHGNLAKEFLAALEHIVGPQENACAICIGADDDMEARRRDILDGVAAVDAGSGVAVLTDMFGGTPSNLALSVLGQAQVEVIAGVNLPMLIRLASIRGNATLPEAVSSAQEAGRKYINVATNLLNEPNGSAAAKADD